MLHSWPWKKPIKYRVTHKFGETQKGATCTVIRTYTLDGARMADIAVDGMTTGHDGYCNYNSITKNHWIIPVKYLRPRPHQGK